MTTTPRWAALIVAAVFSAAACSGPPDPLPVRAAVTWDGGAVPSDDDPVAGPRVEAVREYVRWMNASINALNFSDPGLAAVADELEIKRVYRETRSDVEHGRLTLRAGPPEYSIVQVMLAGDDGSLIEVCQRDATGWNADRYEVEESRTLVGDDIWERRPDNFILVHYWLEAADDRWIVDRVLDEQEYDGADVGGPCDPEDVAFGTFVQQPELDLLHEVTSEMLIGPAGERDEW
ncbi:hypothetical protein [Phytoactinopolyspora endophytica]|uniref:hypothetical protein n=1 Tax=Phytoactinopolyspora endophytica TaxID=1642495 RepID=UPI00101DDAAE|nr:hypothetical protein [Phytoactinopolyspora endophytica]